MSYVQIVQASANGAMFFAMKGTFYEGIQQKVKIVNFNTDIKAPTPSQTPQGSQDFKNICISNTVIQYNL